MSKKNDLFTKYTKYNHNKNIYSTNTNFYSTEFEKINGFYNGFYDSLSKIDYYNKIFARQPKIKKVIFNDPATIVYWEDDTKTVVKCKREKYDAEKGLAMAIAKKALGNNGAYYDVIKKWVGDLMPAPDDNAK